MKKTMCVLFSIILWSGMVFSMSIENPDRVNDQLRDKIDLSKTGGTTRMTGMRSASVADVISIDAYNSNDLVIIDVQNYRGGAWVEIVGSRGARSSYFEVYDMGFEAINIGDLRPGKYTIRIIIDSEVYTGTFNKRTYGR